MIVATCLWTLSLQWLNSKRSRRIDGKILIKTSQRAYEYIFPSLPSFVPSWTIIKSIDWTLSMELSFAALVIKMTSSKERKNRSSLQSRDESNTRCVYKCKLKVSLYSIKKVCNISVPFSLILSAQYPQDWWWLCGSVCPTLLFCLAV